MFKSTALMKLDTREIILFYSSLLSYSGTIHGDAHDCNLLVPNCEDPNNQDQRVCGVIDFNNMVEAPYVYEIGIAIAYTMIKSKNVDPMEVGGLMLAGYTREMELSVEELEAVRICVAARFCQHYVLDSNDNFINNLEPTTWFKNLWKILQTFWKLPEDEVNSSWKNTIRTYKTVP